MRGKISSLTDSWTKRRRNVVQRWPAVPTAENIMPRSARSKSAVGAKIIALLPPSSSKHLPKRSATLGPTVLPMRVLPVALTKAMSLFSTKALPISVLPNITWDKWSGASPNFAKAFSNMAWHAKATKGAFSDGFQMTGLPQTMASAVFQDHTATGKLKAEMTPMTPSGCHVSRMWWPGRSDAIVKPYSWRETPTAKSQISIISCTSPRPSCLIFPASNDTSMPKSSLCSRSTSPSRRINSPRLGAGTTRHSLNAAWAFWIFLLTSSTLSKVILPITVPSIGVLTSKSPCWYCSSLTPMADMYCLIIFNPLYSNL